MVMKGENLMARFDKVIMTAPDLYRKFEITPDGKYIEEVRKRETADLERLFENSMRRLRQPDGAIYPIPLNAEHNGALGIGSIAELKLVDMEDGRKGITATMLIEDEKYAEMLTNGTAWTSPEILWGAWSGVGEVDDIVDYISALAVITEAPAQRDYPAELLAAKANHQAPELHGAKSEVNMSELETLKADNSAKTIELETLKAEKTAWGVEKETLAGRVAELETAAKAKHIESLSARLSTAGLPEGDVKRVLAMIETAPDQEAEMVAWAESLAARIVPPNTDPATITAPGAPLKTKEARDEETVTKVAKAIGAKPEVK